MSHGEKWAFAALTTVVAFTGLAYFYMKYLLHTDDPFAVVNHPWQPTMLAAHVLAAPVFVLVFGMLFRSHVLEKLRSRRKPARRSGWIVLASFAAMAASGYLLQVAVDEAWLAGLSWLHVGTSAVFVVGYAGHLIAGRDRPAAGSDLSRAASRRSRRR